MFDSFQGTKSIRSLRLATITAFACWVALNSLAPSVRAATCAVPSADYVTLQVAVDDPACDTVSIAAGLYTSAITINRSVTLAGAGQETTTLDGQSNHRPLSISGAGIEVHLQNLRIINGNATNASPTISTFALGGGMIVQNGATVWLENVTLNANVARALNAGGGMGGGIAVHKATLHASDVTLFDNSADRGLTGGLGGGLALINANAYLTRTAIFNNRAKLLGAGSGAGGGIYLGRDMDNASPQTISFSMVESSVRTNIAAQSGGPALGGGMSIGAGLSVMVTLRDNEWRDNSALGTGANLANGRGGAIGVDLPVASTVNLTLVGDTFHDNVANAVNGLSVAERAQGGAIYLGTSGTGWLTATLSDTKLYENSAQSGSGATTLGEGGALYARNAVINVARSELHSNAARADESGQGGAFWLENSPFTLTRSIVRNNTATEGAALFSKNSVGQAGKVELTNSWIVDNRGTQSILIDHKNLSQSNRVRHSTVAGSSSGIISTTITAIEVIAGRVSITNSIIAHSAIGISNLDGTVTEAYNLFYNNGVDRAGTIVSSNPILGTPRFINASAGDYHIQSDSDAIDQGTPLGVLDDIDGDLRDALPDVGADEFGDPITGLQISGPSSVVVDAPITLAAELSTGSSVSYAWSFGDNSGETGTTQEVTHAYAATGQYTVLVTATNGSGAVTATKVIQVLPLPVTGLVATNNGPKRVNEPVVLSANTTGGAGITYSWNYGDGSVGSTPNMNASHTYTQSGLYLASVIAANETNSLSASTTVYVGDAVVEVLGNNSFSPRDVTIPLGGKVVWVLRGGTHSVTAVDNSFDQPAGSSWSPFIHTFNSADLYVYYCAVHGLSMSGSVTVEGPPPPHPDTILPNIRKRD
jgi:plastocyanin